MTDYSIVSNDKQLTLRKLTPEEDDTSSAVLPAVAILAIFCFIFLIFDTALKVILLVLLGSIALFIYLFAVGRNDSRAMNELVFDRAEDGLFCNGEICLPLSKIDRVDQETFMTSFQKRVSLNLVLYDGGVYCIDRDLQYDNAGKITEAIEQYLGKDRINEEAF